MASFNTKDPLGLESAYQKATTPVNDPLGLEDAFVKKKVPSNTYSLPGSETLESGGESAQDSGSNGFRTFKDYPVVPYHERPIVHAVEDDSLLEAQQQQMRDAQEEYDKEHPGSWSNTLPQLFHKTIGLVTNTAAGAANITRSLVGLIPGNNSSDDESKSLYKKDLWGQDTGELSDYGKQVNARKNTDYLGRLIVGLDAYNNETSKDDFENSLPKTFLGNTTQGLINIAPIAATTALFPEGEIAEGAAGSALSTDALALQKLKDVVWNPFTKVSAIEGGLNAYDQSLQKGEGQGSALLSGAEGAATEGGQAAIYNILGEVGGKFLSPKMASALTKTGVLKDGAITKMGTDAASDAIIFSAYPIASNLIQGKPVNWDEVEQGLGTGLVFGGMKAVHTGSDFGEADEQLKQTQQTIALKNFYDASPDAIEASYKTNESAADLNAKAVDYAAQAKQETDLDKRKQLIAASSMYQKMADVKTVTQSILGDSQGFIENINSADMTPEQKAALVTKINQVPKIVNGVRNQDPILNFAKSSQEDVDAAMGRPENAQQLNDMATAKGMQAQGEADPIKQQQLQQEQELLQQHADIKHVSDAVMQHGIDSFSEAVNSSELPDDLKGNLISKANEINKRYNPVIQTEEQNKATVHDLTNQIDDLQNTPGATDPVNNPTGVAKLIDLVEQRTDKQVELLDNAIDNPEHLTKPNENEQGKIQEPNEAQASVIHDIVHGTTDGTDGEATDQSSKKDGTAEGGFEYKSKDFGTVRIVPREDGKYDIHTEDGPFTVPKEDIHAFLDDNVDLDKLTSGQHGIEMHATTDPNEVARMYDEKVRQLQDTGDKESAIAAYGPKTNAESFGQVNDTNNISRIMRPNYFRDKGNKGALDVQADEINRQYFNGQDLVSPNDIAEFMIKYPGGAKTFFTPSGNEELRAINERYRELTGKDLTNKKARNLAEKYPEVTPAEIRLIQEHNDSPEAVDKIKHFLDEQLNKPGLLDESEIRSKLQEELDRYVQDPNNEFNLFYDEFKGDLINDDKKQQIRQLIDEYQNEQFKGDSNDSGFENRNSGEETERTAPEGETEPVEYDDLPFQRGEGTNIPPERAEAIQDLMKKVFPNVETIFHPTLEDFAEVAKANHIDTDDLPNAFVDKNGRINFNPEAIHADTQIHEYGHILTQWAKENAPTLYKRMIAFGRDAKDIQKELEGRGYKLLGSRMAEEAFVTILARHGEGKLDEVIKNSGTRGTVSRFINDLWTKFQRYLIDKTGFDISKFKNIKDMPIHEFLDTVNSKYLLSDTKVGDIGTREYSQIDQQKSDRPVRMQDESMKDFMQRVLDWTNEQKTGQKSVDFNKPQLNITEPEGAKFTLEEEKLKPGYNWSETSIKNRVVAEERRARFMDEVEATTKRDFGDVWERGKKMVDDRKIDPAVLAENIIANPRPLSAEETAALTYDRMRLYNDHSTTMDQIGDAMETNNSGAETEARARLTYIENRIEQNDKAARQAGYEQGLGLAARKMIAAQDYSLANQIQLAKIANGGKELPEEIRQKLEDLSKQLDIAQKKLADWEANSEAKAAAISLARLKKEAEAEQRTERKQKRAQSQDQIKKNIESIKNSIYDKLTKNKGTTGTVIPYADKLVEITPDLAKLAKEYIKSGIVTVEGLVDQLHADIKDHIEGITKRDLRDALSGYGKTSKPSKDEIESQLRELKSQMRLTSALEDATNGERPLKSGYVREKPSDTVRELQKKVFGAMRENGIEPERGNISEEDAWRSALETVKTRLRNQINDLNKQIETGIKPEKRGRVIYDQEANDLKAERDRLQKAIDDTEANSGISDEEKVKQLTKTTQDSIAEYEQRIKDFKTTGHDKVGEEKQVNRDKLKSLIYSTPELKAARERLEELKNEHAQLLKDAQPKFTPEEKALETYKTRLRNRIADLEDRMERNDYSVAPKKEGPVLDAEGKRLQSDVNKLKRKFDENREKIRLQNRSSLEKRLDWFAKYRRFVLLASPTTVAKLTAAGATRLITSPLEEIAGHGLSYIPGLDRISEMAPREGGGLSIKAEADALANVLSKRAIQEMYRTIKEGRSELDERVDQKDRTFKDESAFELPGRIHAALKTVPKQVEYYRSLQKRIAWALRNGYDITSPDIQTSLQMESYKDQNPELFTGKAVAMSDLEYQAFKDSKRAIFMQDNFLSDEWTAMINRWNNKGPKGEIAATIARIFLPIIKIPTNFVAESSSLAFGGVKAMFALRNGIEKLSPDDADYVLRALKKQSIGAGFFALGYFLPQYIGGYYRQGEKRKDNEPGADDLEIFGEKVPHWLMHAPVFEVMQMGATVRRIHDQDDKKHVDTGDQIIDQGLATGKGLFGKVPFFSEAGDLSKATENRENASKFAANFVLGLVAPYDVQRVAKWMDEDSRGKEVKRKEKGFIQHLESGIPIVREGLKKK